MKYRERVVPSIGFFIALLLLIPAMYAAFAAISALWAIVAAILSYVVVAGIAIVLSPVVSVDDRELRAGRARIDRALLGTATVYRDTDAAAQRGPQLDARAHLCIRGAVPVVRVDVHDPADPTPYWLVSSRDPESLAQSLNG